MSDISDNGDFPAVIPKKGNKKKKSGGFQSMGFSFPILKAVLRKGYKVPTPIQRKAIPVIMEGKNVVAMARTGSGKTAAFLLPMLEKLRRKVEKSGVRALIFAPTRELAMQTMKFTKELGQKSGLKTALILGGESIEKDFAAMHASPDVIIATPGRFLHVVMEMDLKLFSVQYVVFDEADRLFEMGFQEQLQEVLQRLPSERQTLLFSATLPKSLVEFVKMGVEDPVLIRLDVDLQISENLKTAYLFCRQDDKPAVLLYLLRNIVDTSTELSVVFLATRHHVEYVKELLKQADIGCSYIYSSLDQDARRMHLDSFRQKQVRVLLVTDIAARGLDIPLLDNVINYNFPARPKLFVHRVGRVARAGRSGKAYSLVSSDEAPYLLDLHLFLGKPLLMDDTQEKDGICGSVPQSLVDEQMDEIETWHQLSSDLVGLKKVSCNAYKPYLKSRPLPSGESVKRIKQYPTPHTHPLFASSNDVEEKNKLLLDIKAYRPNTTIFELGSLAKTQASAVMRQKRLWHQRSQPLAKAKEEPVRMQTECADESDLAGFCQVSEKGYQDKDHYVTYVPSQHFKEKGLGIEKNFGSEAANAILDFTQDDGEATNRPKSRRYWDRKKKRFAVHDENDKSKKIKTESGVWIPKSYKTDAYKQWKEKSKVGYQNQQDEEEDSQFGKNRMPKHERNKILKNCKNDPRQKKGHWKSEMKSKEQILKGRLQKDKKMARQKKKRPQLKKGRNKKNKR